jgi:acyl carrier protein
MDEAGDLLPPGASGEIVIRGANVMRGYENNSTANESAFTREWFRTGDQGFLDTDGYLFITCRLKEMINRGGEKISPREIDEVLMNHPAVAQAIAFAMPHPKLGEEVAAAVVLLEQAAATEKEIREFAATRLADFKVPRKVMIVDEIPKGATGKLQRIGLAEKLGLTSNGEGQAVAAADFVAPRTPGEEVLAEIWAQVLGLERVGVHDSFFGLGGDSMLATQLVSRVREVMQVELSLSGFFETPTVANMALAIEEILIDEVEELTEDEARHFV